VHPLSNYHLLRNIYHKPAIADIEKGGVQSNTLRSRYTSLNKFVTFLRKNQVFAGMSKIQLNLLESTIKDFNNDLKTSVQQRKVDVRQHKIKTLLTPADFIKFGRSHHVQNLIKFYKSYSEGSLITSDLIISFRDYLITTLCIGNGLRPSNLMNLRNIDVFDATDAEGYVGQKVISNSTYKTSTIYGEKFIVVAQQLYDQLVFYINNLRPENTKGNRVFTTKGSDQLNQTHISNSLTSCFMKAEIISKKRKECLAQEYGAALLRMLVTKATSTVPSLRSTS